MSENAASAATRPWAEKFLRALRKHKSVTRACEEVGKGRRTVYDFRDESLEFREAWDDAVEGNAADLEAAAFDRATNGWIEPVHYKGEPKSLRRRYSDRLTIFMLRCHRPEVYNIASGDQAPADPEVLGKEVRRDRARRMTRRRQHREAHIEARSKGESDLNDVPGPGA